MEAGSYTLGALQAWYLAQCDGDWERRHGIRIGTLDTPGWRVTIDLAGTPLADHEFNSVDYHGSETYWYECRVSDGRWEGSGGPRALEELVRMFLVWAEAAGALVDTHA